MNVQRRQHTDSFLCLGPTSPCRFQIVRVGMIRFQQGIFDLEHASLPGPSNYGAVEALGHQKIVWIAGEHSKCLTQSNGLRYSQCLAPASVEIYFPLVQLVLTKQQGLWRHTDARIALFSLKKIPLPRAAAPADPTKRAPNEQMDKSRRAFSEEGRNEGAWTMGKMG